MVFKFRDFVPAQETLGLLGEPSLTTLQSALDAANHWIFTFGVEVFNLETLLLPNVRKDSDTIEAELRSGGETTYWYQVVRVWFRELEHESSDAEIRVFDDD